VSRRYFGTDGVRGTVGEAPITPEFVLKLGQAAGRALTRAVEGARPTVLIGKDTRISGYMLEAALEAGLSSAGVDVVLCGPLPTPGVAYLTRALRLDAGIVISASHNPYPDNGIKFFSARGTKLPDAVEARIETELDQPWFCVDSKRLGKARRLDDAAGRYIEFCKRTFPNELDLKGLKIVVDSAHGAAYHVAPPVFHELGAELIALGSAPNGMNINDGVGALHVDHLAHAVQSNEADLGIALDGDADRAIFVCEQGKIIDGDHVMAALALDLHAQRLLAKQTIVGTVMSNFGLELAMGKAGIRLIRTPVGDRYLLERMLSDGYNFGGEQSGHFIFLDHNTTGDGLISALQILSLMKRTKKPLSELAKAMAAVPQVLVNVKVKEKRDLASLPELQRAIETSERRLNGTGRILVRYSGTEPLLRIMVEGEEDATIRAVADDLVQIVRSHLG
jgi:phosphoglucosamine mutase